MTNLYSSKKNAKEFSNTRNHPWAGWLHLLSFLKSPGFDLQSVLDLGCGNGRFLEFLLDSGLEPKNYLGVDNSKELLGIAREKLKDLETKKLKNFPRDRIATNFKLQTSNFINLNLNLLNWSESIAQKFDLIVAFGIMHHLESFEIRKNLIESAHKLLNKNGIFVVTFWKFLDNKNFMDNHLIRELPTDNDFILSFGVNAERFCHYCSKDEIQKLIDLDAFKILENFESDGFANRMNEYFILQKKS